MVMRLVMEKMMSFCVVENEGEEKVMMVGGGKWMMKEGMGCG